MAGKALRSSDRGGCLRRSSGPGRWSGALETGPMTEQPELALPLDSWHRAQGGRMVSFAGYSMPIQYEGIMAEHKWTRESAGLFDVSHMGQLAIHGAESEKALEKFLPADLSLLKEGGLRYSLLLADDAGILDDLMITRRGDHWYMVVNGATKHDDIENMSSRLPRSV